MPSSPYIPRADAQLRDWLEAFAKGVSADPPRYMLTAAQAKDIQKQVNTFLAALMVSSNPETRTKGTVAAKDDARSIAVDLCRRYAIDIKNNAGITDGDKINIGVRPRIVSHAPRKCPATPPLLQYICSTPGVNELRFHDTAAPDSKAKPCGAAKLELWVAHSLPGQPWPGIAEARYIGSFTKSRMLVPTDPEQEARGARPTYWARWQGFDNQVGPWSLPTSLALAAAATKTPKEDKQPMRLAA